MLPPHHPRKTVDEYLAREQHSATKHEFLNGEVEVMAGATLREVLHVSTRERRVMHLRPDA